MAQPARLLSLPPEVFLHIATFLLPSDQAHLCATSQAANAFIEGLLWKDIELHGEDFHNSSAELKNPPPFMASSSRHYLNSNKQNHGNRGRRIAFFYMLDATYKKDSTRFKHLTARIHSLCTVIDYTQGIDTNQSGDSQGWCAGSNEGTDDLMWNLFPHMANLEILELHAEWPGQQYQPVPFDGTLPPLPRLRFAKLFGHFPRDFARYVVLGSASTLERLELGLLDRPVSSYWRNRVVQNQPLPSERVDRRVSVDDQAGHCGGAGGGVLDSEGLDMDNDDDDGNYNDSINECDPDGDSSSDYGSLDGKETFDYIAPRPLGIVPRDHNSTSGSEQQMPVTFPKLKHLYLCKPTEGETEKMIYQMLYSSRARIACTYDWEVLIRGAKETLETLVLEHRTCALCPVEYCVPNSLVVRLHSHRFDEQYFSQVIFPMLKNEGFEKLSRVSLYGIFVGEYSSSKYKKKLVSLCRRRNIQCEGHFGTVCQFEQSDGLGFWVDQGDADAIEEADQFDEDFGESHMRSEIVWKA